jgi:hypothetical protein
VNWLGDVLELLRPKIIEAEVELGPDVLVNCARDDHTAGLCQAFQSSGDIYPIPNHIVVLHNHIAKIDANVKLDAPVLGGVIVALSHALLKRDSTPDGIYNAHKYHEQTIPHRLHNLPPVLGDAGFDQLAEQRIKPLERTFFVSTHQPRVADNVGCDDRRQPSLDAILDHGLLPPRRALKTKFYAAFGGKSIGLGW